MSLISFWRTPAVTLGFSSIRIKSAPFLFLYAFFQSSFACIYCCRRKNVLNMGGRGGKAKDIGDQGLSKGVNFQLAENRLAGWKSFKHPLSLPAVIKN